MKISFFLKGKSNSSLISVRLTISRGKQFRRSLPLTADSKRWSKVSKKTYGTTPDEKKINDKLDKFEVDLKESYNEAITEGEVIDSLWLKNQIDKYFNQSAKDDDVDYSILNNYADYFIKQKTKQYDKGQLTKGSLKKYKVIVKRLKAFQKHINRTLKLRDINLETTEQLENYLLETHKLSVNTTGRFIKFFKQIALHARDNKSVRVLTELNRIKGYTVEAEKIYLTFKEIDDIIKADIKKPHLDNARDWLIIGCYTGQRVSDLLRLRKHHIVEVNGTQLIQIKQVKTNKDVSIPIHPKVQDVLNKHGQDFPKPLTDQKFNDYIKIVCRIAGITEMTRGSKLVNIAKPKEKNMFRKKSGVYEKCDMVTSHICRRSFATNFYGIIPTPLLIGITAHSTEKQYLEYVGKPEQEKSLEVAKLWNKTNNEPEPEPKGNNEPKVINIRKAQNY